MGLFSKLFGNHTDRELKKIYPIVDKIEALEPQMQALSDEELRAKTKEFQDRYDGGEELDSLLPEAFAAVREAAWRVLGMKPFRVQLIGGIVLHQGRIAEMKTGEGKTLVAVMPAYLNAITGDGVHIVTVNDYLARRDSEWMGKVHRFMGLDVGLIVHGLTNEERKAEIAAFYTSPEENAEVLQKYDVNYIYVSSYERGSYDVDEEALDWLYTKVFENMECTIYQVPEG